MNARQQTATAIDAELEIVHRHRERLLRAEPSPARSQLLADVYDHEAWLWSQLFRRAKVRLAWRAALNAELHARAAARSWRRRAAGEPVSANVLPMWAGVA